MKEKKKVVLQV